MPTSNAVSNQHLIPCAVFFQNLLSAYPRRTLQGSGVYQEENTRKTCPVYLTKQMLVANM